MKPTTQPIQRRRETMIMSLNKIKVMIIMITMMIIFCTICIGCTMAHQRPWNLPSSTTTTTTVSGQRNNRHNHRRVVTTKTNIIDGRKILQQSSIISSIIRDIRGGYSDSYPEWSSYGQRPPKSYEESYNTGDSSSSSNTNKRYYDDDDYIDDDYDDYMRTSPSSRTTKRSDNSLLSNIPRIIKYGDRKVGMSLLSLGAITTFIGFTLFLNRTLLRLGNLMFISGVPITIGPKRTINYFAKREKIRATGCLLIGIILVYIGNPIFGIIFELFGLLNLFGNTFPMVFAILKQVPILGNIIKVLDNAGSNGGSSSKASYNRKKKDDDYYYYDDNNEDYDDYYRGSNSQDGYSNRDDSYR